MKPNTLEKYQCRICFHFEHASEMPNHFIAQDLCYGCAKHRMAWEKAFQYPPSFDYSLMETLMETETRSFFNKMLSVIRNLFNRKLKTER